MSCTLTISIDLSEEDSEDLTDIEYSSRVSTDKTACGEGNIGLARGDLVTTHTGQTGGDLLATLGMFYFFIHMQS